MVVPHHFPPPPKPHLPTLAQSLRFTCLTRLNPPAGGKVPPTAAAAAQRDTALWVAWLAGCLAVPLLRAHFYATETGTGRQTVCYFR